MKDILKSAKYQDDFSRTVMASAHKPTIGRRILAEVEYV
jgi:hypothetical protein